MILFTTGDIKKLIEVPATTIDEWCKKGHIKPISGGNGHGNHRQWSLTQAVGFHVAEQLRQAPRGCVLEYYGDVVEGFGAMPEEKLRTQLAAGQTRLAMVNERLKNEPGDVVLAGDTTFDWPDVACAYEKVQKYVKKYKR